MNGGFGVITKVFYFGLEEFYQFGLIVMLMERLSFLFLKLSKEVEILQYGLIKCSQFFLNNHM
jgi:hypothetical protein